MFCKAERNKGLQNPVASQAVCRRRAAVLMELSSRPRRKANVARPSPDEGKSDICSEVCAVKHVRPFRAPLTCPSSTKVRR